MGGALGSLADADPSTTIKNATAQGVGAPSGVDPIAFLKAQVNRFSAAAGGPGPVIGDVMMPVDGNVDKELLSRTAQILAATGDLNSSFVSAAVTVLPFDDGTYLRQFQNEIIDRVRQFADRRGMPAAAGLPINPLYYIAAIGVAVLIFVHKGKG